MSHRVREILSWTGLFVAVVLPCWAQSVLPGEIPVHFDLEGNANGWAPPRELFWLTAIAIFLYLLVSYIERIPQHWNYPVRVTEENRARLEPICRSLMGWIKVEAVWMMVGILLGIILTSVSFVVGTHGWVTPHALATHAIPQTAPITVFLALGSLTLLVTIAYYYWQMIAAARRIHSGTKMETKETASRAKML